MSYAILVKPAVWKSADVRSLVDGFRQSGAYVIKSASASDIKQELIDEFGGLSALTVIAIGGDGTVHLALNAIAESGAQLAVIAKGTGNDFARCIGVRHMEDALSAIATNSTALIDIGRITLADGTVRYFAGVTSCGFDAEVNRRANTMRGPSGTTKYVLALFKQLSALKPFALKVAANDQEIVDSFTLIAIGNTPSYGGGMQICPDAHLADGTFDVTYVREAKRRTLVQVLPKVFWGGHMTHDKVFDDQASHLVVSGDDFWVYADGEEVGQGPAEFEVIPSALRVFTPLSELGF